MGEERMIWIDQLRGLAMMAILWFHTEMYYAGEPLIDYNFYVPNALTVFYFLSGYLFHTQKPFNCRRKLKSIARNIVVPYFIFTLLLAFPKAYMNGIPVSSVIIKILLGNGSWFVSSLIVAEVLLALVLHSRKSWLLHLLPIAALAGAYALTGSPISDHHNYWNFHNAMIGVAFLYAGYVFHRHESRFGLIAHPAFLFIATIALIGMKYVEWLMGISLMIDPVAINNYPVFVLDMLTGILLMVGLSRHLPRLRPVEWTGRHSLYYYFFCGAVPMAVATLLNAIHLPYGGSYWPIPIVFLMIWLLSSAIAYTIVFVKGKIR